MLRRCAFAAVAALAFAAPAAASAGERYVDPVFQSVEVEAGVPFGSAVNNRGELQELLLDVYRPAGDAATGRAAVVFAHGGGFRSGSRSAPEILPLLEGYAKRGYVALSIDYRLRPTGTPGAVSDPELVVQALTGDSPTITEAQEDMQAAVRWTRAHAAELGVDPELIFVGGESAGGITAWETAINPAPSAEVGAAVSLWGAADPDHIEAGAPPVIDLHGAADTSVPLAFGAQACGLMTVFGSVCEMVVWPAERHAAFHRADDILATSANFLCRRAIPGCQAPAPPAPVSVH
jgi:acetyl esterase/lipase